MEIISHRGFWQQSAERNQRIAFSRSFDMEMGTETDLRDHNGEIVISHDMPTGEPITFSDFLRIMNGRNLTLALNIKADGLSEKIKEILAEFHHTNYFVFDMSIPDLVCQVNAGLTAFTGLSDIQPTPVLLDRCQGVWLDCFNADWYGPEVIDDLIEKGKRVCLVSADIHKRETTGQWCTIKKAKHIDSPDLLLCTDKPLEAIQYFKG